MYLEYVGEFVLTTECIKNTFDSSDYEYCKSVGRIGKTNRELNKTSRLRWICIKQRSDLFLFTQYTYGTRLSLEWKVNAGDCRLRTVNRFPPQGKDYNDYLCDRLELPRTVRKPFGQAR